MNKKSKSCSSHKKKSLRKRKTATPSKAPLIRRYNAILNEKKHDSEKLKKLVDELYKNRFIDQARMVIKEINKIETDFYESYYKRGTIDLLVAMHKEDQEKLSKEYYLKAIDEFEKAKILTPEIFKIYPQLSFAYSRIGELKKADNVLKNVLIEDIKKIKDNFKRQQLMLLYDGASKMLAYQYFLKLGYPNLERNKFKEAIKGFRKAIQHHNNFFLSYYYLAISFLYLSQYENSLKAFTQCINISPHIPGTYFWIGFLYLVQNQYEKASVFLQNCLNIQEIKKRKNKLTKNAKIFYSYNLGMICWQKGLFEEAKNYFQKINVPDNAHGFLRKKTIRIYLKIIDIDKELSLLYLSKDLNNLARKFGSLYNEVRNFKNIIEEVQGDKIIASLLLVKFYIIFNLTLCLSPLEEKRYIKEGLKKALGEKKYKEDEKDEFGLGFSMKRLKRLNLSEAITALEGVKNFIKEIKSYDDPFILPVSTQKEIIKKLGSHLKVLNGQISRTSFNENIKGFLFNKLNEISMSQKKLLKTVCDGFNETKDEIQQILQKSYKSKIKISPKDAAKVELPKEVILKTKKSKEDVIARTLRIMFTQGKSVHYIPPKIKDEIIVTPGDPKKYVVYYTGRNKFNCSDKAINIIRENPKDFNIQIFLDFDGKFLVERVPVELEPQERKGLRCFLKWVGLNLPFLTFMDEVWENEKKNIDSSDVHNLRSKVVRKTKYILKVKAERGKYMESRYKVGEDVTYCLIDSTI